MRKPATETKGTFSVKTVGASMAIGYIRFSSECFARQPELRFLSGTNFHGLIHL
jgi:hypothetical protein